MTIEYLVLCILLAKYRDRVTEWCIKHDEKLTDYQQEMRDALICDAPKSRRHLRVVK